MNAAGRTLLTSAPRRSFFGAAEFFRRAALSYCVIFLCAIPRWQLMQGEAEDALFEVQKGFLSALHDEAVENIAHGEQKFF